MKGVLILAHGSKRKETEETLDKIIEALKGELRKENEMKEIEEIESAFLQFSERSLHTGLEALMNKGVNDILLVPYFLFDGAHIKEDIPEEIEEFTNQYPNIRVNMGKTLGTDVRLALILKDRILEMM
jgi:sirohydrochlorin ferrochelatase